MNLPSFFALALGAALLVPAPAVSGGVRAPAAIQVKATVHASSTLSIALLALTPASDLPATESLMIQNIAAFGLGEVMGWGVDYFDNVEPAVVAAITTSFQAALRLVENLGTPPMAQLSQIAGRLSGHFDKMRVATAAGDLAGQKRQMHALAEHVVLRLRDLPDGPMIEEPAQKLDAGIRHLKAGAAALEAGLAAFPPIAAQVAPQLAGLKALALTPPATAEELVEQALPLVEAVEAATR